MGGLSSEDRMKPSYGFESKDIYGELRRAATTRRPLSCGWRLDKTMKPKTTVSGDPRSAPQPDGAKTLGETVGAGHQVACADSGLKLEESLQAEVVQAKRVSEFLVESLGNLSSGGDLRVVLESVIVNLARTLGAAHVFLFRHDEAAHTLRLELACVDGYTRWGMCGDELPLWAAPFPDDVTPAWRLMCEARRLFTPDMVPIPVEDFAWPGAFDYARRLELSDMGHIVLFTGEVPIGSIDIGWRNGRRMVPADRPFIEAVAQQAAVAIRLLNTAEEAEKAAVMRERQKAAEARAAELAKANEAFSATVEELAHAKLPEELIPLFLKNAISSAGALAGAVLKRIGGTEFEFAAIQQGGRLLAGQELKQHPFNSQVKAVSRTDPAGHFAKIVRGETVWRLAGEEGAGAISESDRWPGPCEQRALWDVPFRLGSEVSGYLAFAFEGTDGPSPIVRDTIATLAQQVALGLELSRLTAEAQQSAIDAALSRERERAAQERSLEFARASEVLERSVARMNLGGDLHGLLDSVLTESVRASGAVSGAIFLYDEKADVLFTRSFMLRGQLLDLDNDGRWHDYRDAVPAKGNLVWEVIGLNREIFWVDYLNPDPRDWPQSKAFHDANGHRFVACVPMVHVDQALGFMGLAYDQSVVVQPSEARLELCRVLAQQAALAVQLTKLAEESKRASVAREQEKAAQQRAEELDRINGLLRDTSQLLGMAKTTEEVFEKFLLQTVDVVNGSTGSLLRRLAGTEHELVAFVQDGKIIPRADWPDEAMLTEARQITRQGSSGMMARSVAGEEVWVIVDNELEKWAPASAVYHRKAGNQSFIHFPFFVDGEYAGCIRIGFPHQTPPTQLQRETVRSLSTQASVALGIHALAEHRELAVIAQEREKASEERAADLACANAALQDTIDALGSLNDLSDFIPAVLRIVTRVFSVESAAYYEYFAAKRISLRYWMGHGVVHSPTEIKGFFPEHEALVEELISGFEVPVEHIRRKKNGRSQAVQLNHAAGTALARFDSFCISQGWNFEINVPLMINGVAEGALVILRETEFSQSQMDLAEALAKQIAFALQATRLSTQAKERAVQVAVAREQEKAAEARAAELERTSAALRRGVQRLADSGDLEFLLGAFLLEAIDVSGAHTGTVFTCAGRGTELHCRAATDGEDLITDLSAVNWVQRYPEVSAADPYGVFKSILEGDLLEFPLDAKSLAAWFPEKAAFHERLDHRYSWNVAIRIGEESVGFMGLSFKEERHPSPALKEMLKTLAQQISLALEVSRLAAAAREAAIAREQEKAARARAGELAKTNAALKATLGTLATGASGRDILSGIISVLREATSAVSVLLQVIDVNLLDVIAGDSKLEMSVAIPGLATYLAARQQEFTPLSECYTLAPEEKEVFLQAGIRSQLTVPLSLGEELIGALMIRLPDETRPGSELVELSQALAHQATLAIRLLQLAATTREEAMAKASSEERAALAREFHDTLLQSFTGVTLQLRALARQGSTEGEARALIAAIEQQATEAIQEARKSVSQIRGPKALDLATEVKRFLASEPHPAGVAFQFEEHGERRTLPAAVENDFLRIVQEAVRNAARHSGGSLVRVSISHKPEGVRILVEDDGNGFKLEEAVRKKGHFGLDNMYERAQRVGASFDIRTAPEQGTLVMVEFTAQQEGAS